MNTMMCRRFRSCLGIVVLLLACFPLLPAGSPSRVVAQTRPLSGRTIYVSGAYEGEEDGSRERPYRTISGALAVAEEGDRILVAGGRGITYVEVLTVSRPVHLQGGYNPQTWDRDIQLYETVIDGAGQGSVVAIGPWATERQDILFEGFMIRNGSSPNNGGGLYIYQASPQVLRNRINGNWAEGIGGGIAVAEAAPLILENTIEMNTAASGGGGIALSHSNAILINNLIISNYTGGADGGGMSIDNQSRPIMSENIIAANSAERGGGILVTGASRPIIANSVLYLNMANEAGGAILADGAAAEVTNVTILENIPDGVAATELSSTMDMVISLTNCILWGHGGSDLVGNSLKVRYSDVESGAPPGEGNLSVDPLLRDAQTYDFHLRADSPLIDAGTNDIVTVPGMSLETDFEDDRRFFDGNGDGFAQVDIGADEVAANLRDSSKEIVPEASLPTNGGFLQYLINLNNGGQIAATNAVLTDTLAASLSLRAGSLYASAGTVVASDGKIVWRGSVPISETVTIAFVADVSEMAAPDQAIINIAQIDYGADRLWYVPSIVTVVQKRVVHLPLVLRAFSGN